MCFSQGFKQKFNDGLESTIVQFQLRGSKLLMCSRIKNTQDGGDGRLKFQFNLKEFEDGKEMPAVLLFSTVWTRSEMGFFDFDESHVVYNFKESRSFAVVCIKTGVKL